jgi:hypothetical protein
MIAPVRPYRSIFSYTGGAQKSLRGFMSMKKHDDNPIGNLVLEDLKKKLQKGYTDI